MKTKRKPRKNWLSRFFLIAFLLIAGGGFLICRPTRAVLAEINPDDWKLELFFFDETINNGKDPIVDEKWIIDSSSKIASFNRTITMQINYKNENVDRTYSPGELQITVPNPFKGNNSNVSRISVSTTVGANGASYNSYAWDFNYSSYNSSDFVFTNHDELEALANVEGSIQVVYVINSYPEYYAEQFEDSCTRSISADGMKAILNNAAESNEASFEYSRTYNHPWSKAEYKINTTASKIQSYDGLGENPDQYTWVRYYYYGASTSNSNISYSTEVYHSTSTNEQYIGLSSYRVNSVFPEGIRVVDSNGNILTPGDNYVYNMPDSAKVSCGSYNTCYVIYVGYPKDTYSVAAGTNQIQNIVNLDGIYTSEDEEGLLASKTVSVDLSNFDFSYTGSGISARKEFSGAEARNTLNTNGKPFYYEYITSSAGQYGTFTITASARYEGTKQTVRVGDDLVYYYDGNTATTKKMNDNDYYFSSVTVPSLKNGNGNTIPNDKYGFSIFVRYRGESSFTKYGDYDKANQTVTFNDDAKVQAWYIEISDLEESLQNVSISTRLTLKSATLPENGTLHNFGYMNVYQNGILINPGSLENYAEGITRDYIAQYDEEHYGSYLYRFSANTNWSPYVIPKIEHSADIGKSSASAPIYKPDKEEFTGSFRLNGIISDYTSGGIADWDLIAGKISDSDMNHSIKMYDLLPLGMIPDSTAEEIINSIDYCPSDNSFKQKDGSLLFNSTEECQEFVTSHTNVAITKNWHNTGRWHIAIEVDFSDRPFTTYNSSNGNTNAYSTHAITRFTIKYRIPYDAYAEYGRTFKNMAYLAPERNWGDARNNHDHDNDDGSLDPDVVDINDNGRTDERLWSSSLNITLVSVTSTVQDLQVSVLTDHSGTYEVDDVQSGYGEDYVYKLRLRTGTNKVTNAVLYDHIEESYANEEYWQGSFNGIDTSYAETKLDYNDKKIKIKTYWSPNAKAGSLEDDASWQEYDEEATDKTKVRSLAFQYLNENDEPAILMPSTYTYVLIKMKAPDNKNVNVFAYNASASEWNAIDNLTGDLIYNIVGIESNITRVYLAEAFNLKVTKVWEDYDDYYKIRPETLIFKLLKDGEEVESKEMNVGMGETELSFKELNVLEQEKYTIVEVDVDGYDSTFNRDNTTLAYTFTNTIDAANPNASGTDTDDSTPDNPTPDKTETSTGDTIQNPQTSDTNLRLFVISSSILMLAIGIGVKRLFNVRP